MKSETTNQSSMLKKNSLAPATPRLSTDLIPDIARFFDAIIFIFTSIISHVIWLFPSDPYINEYIFATIFFITVYIYVGSNTKIFWLSSLRKYGSQYDEIIILFLLSTTLFFSVIIALQVTDRFSITWLISFICGSLAGIYAARLALAFMLRRLGQSGAIGRRLAILGAGEQSARFLSRLESSDTGFINVIGVFSPAPPAESAAEPMNDVAALLRMVRAKLVDDVVVAMPWNRSDEILSVIDQLKELPINVYISTDLVGYQLTFRRVSMTLADLPMYEVIQKPISGWSKLLKWLEDYIIATISLILISPILIVIAIAIKMDSPGPVFFRQRRLGFNNEEFMIYKFRSMRHDFLDQSNEKKIEQAKKHDPRVTRVGRLIRATSLDELPQLFNVLNGTMSLVGPRPHAVSHNEEFGRRIRGYFARHRVKPGITGWAQVNGLRGETETIEKMEARIRHDVYYAENWSLFFDLRILVQTALVVLFQKSAY